MERFIREKIEQNLIQLTGRMVLSEEPLTGFLFRECGYKEDHITPMPDETWREFGRYERWGEEFDSHAWFYKKVKTEQANTWFTMSTGESADWMASVNPQIMVFVNGKLVQGLDTNHTEILLEEPGEYDIHLYAYNGMEVKRTRFLASLKRYDEAVRKLYYDLKVPYDVCLLHEKEEKAAIDVLGYLERAVNYLDYRVGGKFAESVQAALSFLEKEFYGKFCGKNKCEGEVICIGHTHIDIAWLWTLAQTREKALRSFSTVISLMKQYPEYKFMSSQVPLYQYVKEQDPALYEEIKAMVKAGRWEVEGAMWLEADCNLSSGESLVRQLLYGKRFFKKEFDVDCNVLWLPDVFGYSAALPQILKKSGVNRFVTSKISWSETNTMPNDTFYWQGIDGTEILSYFLTAQDKIVGRKPVNYTTYSGVLNAAQTAGTWERYQNKDISEEVIITYGWGDGGGGPTAEMIEHGKRLEKGIPGAVNVRFDTVTAFLDKLEKSVKRSEHVPKWVGELYLEFHRGTYTSMGKNKKYNRKSEFLYQTAESLAVSDMVLNGTGYPQETINSMWELIMLNQFHDIIPGSSIKEVYETSEKQYLEILDTGKNVAKAALDHVAGRIKTEGGILVYNPLSFANSGIVEVDGEKLYVENIPAKGYKVVKDAKKFADKNVSEGGVTVLKEMHGKPGHFAITNRFVTVFIADGDIIQISDKKNKRDLLKKGRKANVLRAFEDYPKQYDNWEITSYYKDKMWEVTEVESIEPFEDEVSAGVKVRRRFLNSVIEQKITLYAQSPRIDFETYVDWKQDHVLLKAFFPLDIHAEKATFDIQFGTVERPTHRNTSWDAAKFEVCAHKFADISEDDFGVSLLNDCKYGYDVLGSDMSITLIKSGTHPNPDADKCEHTFTYSLYPHAGNHKQGGTIQEAYRLNIPMYATRIGKTEGELPEEYSLVSCSAENVIVETVKKAEDDDAIIVRMYEAYNRRTKAELTFGFEVKECYLADLSENTGKKLQVKNNRVAVEVKPFEIVTLKVVK